MRGCARKALPLAMAVLLIGAGAALAGDSADATFALGTAGEISGVGAGETIQMDVVPSGLVGVKQFEIRLQVRSADNFNLNAVTLSLLPAADYPMTNWLPLPNTVDGNTVTIARALLDLTGTMSTMGDVTWQLTFPTSDSFTAGTEEEITLTYASVGPSSADRDVFETADIGVSVLLNPPAPAPTVTAIDPANGLVSGGISVTITGTNFAEGAGVAIGGVQATDVALVDATTITATVPAADAAGAADVVVTNADGQAGTLAGGFTYDPIPAPSIAGIDPAEASVAGNIAATVSGADFQDGATVTIGGADAAAVFVDASTLTVTVPAGAAGAADVVVTNPDGQSATSAGAFTYSAIVNPTLTAIIPTDRFLDYSSLGSGNVVDESAGETTMTVRFTGASGGATAGQDISFNVFNNGAELVYVLGATVTEIAVGESADIVVATGDDGAARITLDSEGDRDAASTSVIVGASTSADNSVGETLDLAVEFSVQWDAPVVAELASLAGRVVPGDAVLIEWTVPSQLNNLGWEVHRSVDNVHFERVGEFIAGDGTTDAFKSYSFADDNLPAAEVVYYYLEQVDLDGSLTQSQVIEVDLAAGRAAMIPERMALLQNFPNPFNPETTIGFDLSVDASVTLRVYDLTGQVIRTLAAGEALPAGHYERAWDGLDLNGVPVASGVYFYEINADGFSALKKMTLLR